MTLRHAAFGCLCCSLTITTYFAWASRPFTSHIASVQAAEVNDFSFTGEPTDRSSESYQGSFLYTDLPSMLSALKVTVYPEDKVYAFPEPGLGLGSHIEIYRAQPVLIRDGKDDTLVRTWSSKVGDILAERKMEVGDKDKVDPDKQSVIEIGKSTPIVIITRVAESQVTTTQPIDYKTEYKDDPDLEKGNTVKEQVGKNGTLEKVYLVRRENGEEISRKLIAQNVTKEAVTEIIRRGTKVVDYGSGKASWYSGVGSMTAAHKTLPMGTKVKVINTATGASVIVTIADRGPFVAGRVIDLSSDAFSQIALTSSGVASVRLEKVY